MLCDLAAQRRRLLATAEARPEGLPLPGFGPALQADLFLSRWLETALHADAAVANWISRQRGMPRLRAVPQRLDQTQGWRVDPESGNIVHESGRFFAITGIQVRHRNVDRETFWDQPIIDQPEVGILGILAKPIDGILHFCLQAKEEPGNIGGVQLSPTVQATYSNYTGVHGGNRPLFLEHFLNPQPERILFARLQSEDGGRFLYKSNRNMIVLLPAESEDVLPENFIWLTLRQISGLMHQHNLLHATTRSILAALFGAGRSPALPDALAHPQHEFRQPETTQPGNNLAASIAWLDQCRANHHYLIRRVGINTLDEWHLDSNGFLSHREDRFFRVIGLNVSGADREVASWGQPILCNPEIGIIGLLQREHNGRREFLMQAKAEAGHRSLVQIAPTVQFTPGNYIHNPRLGRPFLFEEFKKHSRFPVISETLQAEEGARFYRECHSHRVLHLPEPMEIDLPADYRWLGEDELLFFLHFGDMVNACARSILACLL